MAKIYLFGSASIKSITGQVEQIMQGWLQQGHEFIVADGRGADSAFHMSLSRIGARDKATVYVMDNVYNNKFGLQTKIFSTAYNTDDKQIIITDKETGDVIKVIEDVEQIEDVAVNRDYTEFRDKHMMDECAAALCMWDGESKREFHRMQLLGIKNKPCYTYKI